MGMPTLQVTLSDRAATAAKDQAIAAGCVTVDDDLTKLIEADTAVPISPAVEAELLVGLRGDGIRMTAADWAAERAALAATAAVGSRP